jgi:hypothetical protein
MAIYVWYEGKNVMENWNIMKNTLKTDEDEEILEGDIERDSSTETVNMDVCEYIDDNDVQMQIQYLNDTSKVGMLQIDYQKKLQESEDDRVAQMMASDPIFRKTYNAVYHHPDADNGNRTMILMPDEIFIDEEEAIAAREKELH